MIERAATWLMALTLACLLAAGVRFQLTQLNSAIAQRLAALRTVAGR